MTATASGFGTDPLTALSRHLESSLGYGAVFSLALLRVSCQVLTSGISRIGKLTGVGAAQA
jgi:hypothetical protein